MQVWPEIQTSFPLARRSIPLETGPRMVPVVWDPSYYVTLGVQAPPPTDGQAYVYQNGEWVLLDPLIGPCVFINHGPPSVPPPAIAKPGDSWIDLDTGNVYAFS